MAEIEPFALPPEEAVRWFREKGYRFGFDWRDTWQHQHAASFTVAKVMQLDILSDIRSAVDDAIAKGLTLREFQKQLAPTLQRKGWWGEKEQVDPKTGEVKTVQLGSPRRLRIIYDTNLRQAHAAGRWERIQRQARRRPYLRYVARSPAENRRAEHQAWSGKVWRVDDPIWQTIYPPNGWGCECKVQQLNDRDLERLGLKVSAAPKLKLRTYTNARTGEVSRVPVGVDPGFAYNAGLGRRGVPPQDLPTLEPVRTWRDYGRPEAKASDRVRAPARLDAVPKGRGKLAAVKEHFRRVFGTSDAQQSVQVADPTGVQVTFDERVLPRHIARGAARERYLPHAKATVEDPYEVWLVPLRRRDGSVVIRQRYIGLYAGGRGAEDVMVITEADGAFNVFDVERVDRYREGYLHYAR